MNLVQLMNQYGHRARQRRSKASLKRNTVLGETLESRHLLAGDSLVISEVMASNGATLRDRFREYSDWVEIHNPTASPVSLAGWHLTDDAGVPGKWEFPDVTIDAGGYLVVHASGRNEIDPARELHTSFSLSSQGEYMALTGPDETVVDEISPGYPELGVDVSYGLVFGADGVQEGQYRFYSPATPGAVNDSASYSGFVKEVTLSAAPGYYDEAFELSLSTATAGAKIRYTTDGTAPTADHGMEYTGPITISTTTMLRAGATAEGFLPSRTETATFIFLEAVLRQDGAGLPTQWGYFDDQGPRPPARAKANYMVDPEVVDHPNYKDRIRDDLRSLPTISIVMDPNDLWDFEKGLYTNPMQTGPNWERAASMEYYNVDGELQFQVDAGLRVHGGWARRPSQTAKRSFRVHFRGEYGTPLLDYPMFGEDGQQEFQALVLRGGFNDSWAAGGNSQNTYTQDQWARQAQLDMGGFTSRSNYAHLYLNGLYWGLYSPTERMNAEWASAYQGGEPEEWDVINTGGNVIDGDSRAYQDLMREINKRPVNYERIKELIDVEDYINYMIVNQYVGNWDWPHNNWYMSKRKVEGAKWHFHSWDAEGAFQNGIADDRINGNIQNVTGPAQIYLALRTIPEFQELYADKIYEHLFNGGELSEQSNTDRLNSIADQIRQAIVGESARWGDGREDAGRPVLESTWTRRIEAIIRTYFPERLRAERMLRLYRAVGLYPEIAPPVFDPHGGQVEPGTNVKLNTDLLDGVIYYTTDGSDPRGADGEASPSAIRLNTVDFIFPNSPAKVLIPTGAASESGWETADYDDASWTNGFASIGYDNGQIDDPIATIGGFKVVEWLSSEPLNSMADVRSLLAGNHVSGTTTVENVPVINYLGGTRGGNFDGDSEPPSGSNDFALDATTKIQVQATGKYTFAIARNDGAFLEIDGQLVFEDPQKVLTSTEFVTVELTAGVHDFRALGYDRSGTYILEVAYAVGEKTAIDASFRLLGDIRNRPFGDLIETDLQASLLDVNSSAYVRIPFEVSNLAELGGLVLKTKYDDGYVVYLNGTQVATAFAPEVPAFNSVATDRRSDVESRQAEIIDLTAQLPLLKVGRNVLAIQALNASAGDNDLLMAPELFASRKDVPITIESSALVRARQLAAGEWSALTVAEFTTAEPASTENLRISEIHYHPRTPSEAEIAAGFNGADDFEFIELVNIGSKAIDLRAVKFLQTMVNGNSQGVAFDFASGGIRELEPGGHVVIVEDLAAFRYRYGDQLPVAGQWTGGLSNSTETITLLAGEQTVHQFAYSDLWYPLTDGGGVSLEVATPATTPLQNWLNPGTWRSGSLDGTPGRAPGHVTGDSNGDGVFSSEDILAVFQSGKYEDGIAGNATFAEGDWDGDGDFTSADFIFAFTYGLYVEAPPAAALPAVESLFEQDELESSSSRREFKSLDLTWVQERGANHRVRDRLFSAWLA